MIAQLTPPEISCEHAIRSIWDYLDGEIDDDRRQRIRHHLTWCNHCRETYAFERRLMRSLSRLVDDDHGGDEYDATATLRIRIEHALIEHGYPPQ